MGIFSDPILGLFQCPPADDVTTVGAVPGVCDTVWDQVQLAVPSNPKLTRDAEADVVVEGAGIAGLSVAYNLAKAGKKVIVLESRAIGMPFLSSSNLLHCISLKSENFIGMLFGETLRVGMLLCAGTIYLLSV